MFSNWVYPGQAVLKPQDAYNIEVKMDDGNPGTGNLIALNTDDYLASLTGPCVDKNYFESQPVNFILSGTEVTCRLWYYYLKN